MNAIQLELGFRRFAALLAVSAFGAGCDDVVVYPLPNPTSSADAGVTDAGDAGTDAAGSNADAAALTDAGAPGDAAIPRR